jgi:hypothetical protein
MTDTVGVLVVNDRVKGAQGRFSRVSLYRKGKGREKGLTEHTSALNTLNPLLSLDTDSGHQSEPTTVPTISGWNAARTPPSIVWEKTNRLAFQSDPPYTRNARLMFVYTNVATFLKSPAWTVSKDNHGY